MIAGILANNSKLLFILGIVLVITDIFSYLWIFTTIDIDIREGMNKFTYPLNGYK